MLNNFTSITQKKQHFVGKRMLLFLLLILFFINNYSYADFSQFKQNLENIGVPTSLTQEKQILYRNDVVRLLSTIQCNDCLHPDQTMIDEYNTERWSKFITLP
jgi:hypothetical protein